jgi:hypothetical protein
VSPPQDQGRHPQVTEALVERIVLGLVDEFPEDPVVQVCIHHAASEKVAFKSDRNPGRPVRNEFDHRVEIFRRPDRKRIVSCVDQFSQRAAHIRINAGIIEQHERRNLLRTFERIQS